MLRFRISSKALSGPPSMKDGVLKNGQLVSLYLQSQTEVSKPKLFS